MEFEKSYPLQHRERSYYGPPVETIYESPYGVKIYKLKNDKGETYIEKKTGVHTRLKGFDVLRDIATLRRLDHPDIIKILDVYIGENDEFISFIMPAAKTTIDELDYDILPFKRKKIDIYQIIRGMSYYMSRDVIHLDIKPENIAVFEGGKVEIIDFGIARSLFCSDDANMNEKVYTIFYKPPEVLLNGKYNKSADIWALGCAIYAILYDELLFDDNDEIQGELEMMKSLITKTGDIVKLWPNIINLPNWNMIKDFYDTHMKILRSRDNYDEEHPEEILAENLSDMVKTKHIDSQINYIEANIFLKSIFQIDPGKRANIFELLNFLFFDEVRDEVDKVFPAKPIHNYSCEENLDLRVRIPTQKIDKTKVIKAFEYALYMVDNDREYFSNQSFFYFMYLFDEYAHSFVKYNLTDFSRTCLQISSVLKEATTTDLLYDRFGIYFELLKISEFDFIISTVYDYFVIYKEYYDKDVKKLAIALLYSTIFSSIRYDNHPKHLALACIVQACCYYSKTFKHTSILNDNVISLSKYIITNIGNDYSSQHTFRSKSDVRISDLIEKTSNPLCVL